MNAPNIKPAVIVIRAPIPKSQAAAGQGGESEGSIPKEIAELISEFKRTGELCGAQLQKSGILFLH